MRRAAGALGIVLLISLSATAFAGAPAAPPARALRFPTEPVDASGPVRVTRPGATLLARVNTVGDVASRWGDGVEREPDLFEVEPGQFKRFFSEQTLRATLEPAFMVGIILPRQTLVFGQHPKQTLVVRATRRDEHECENE